MGILDGKRFNYIKTGDAKLSNDAIRKLSKLEKKTKDKLEKKNRKNILDSNYSLRRSVSRFTTLLMDRRRSTINKNPSTTSIKKKNMKKKKETVWQKLVNGAAQIYTRSFIATRNLAKKLYEFLDDV